MSKKRLLFPDFLRILAAFSIVLIHVTSIGINNEPTGSSIWRMCAFFNALSYWAVPVFFMLSGMMFLDPSRELPLKKLFGKNVARIVLCVVLWGFFYSLLDQYQFGGLSWKSPILAVYGILTGSTGYHLWFLYALLGLYLATPTLRVFTMHATRRQVEYALAVWFALSICIPDINRIAGALLDLDGVLPIDALVIADSAGFFLLGHYLHHYGISEKHRCKLYVLTAFILCAVPILSTFIAQEGAFGLFSNRMGVGSSIIATGIFVFASQLQMERLPERVCHWIQWLSSRTFGIYLIHVFFVSLFFRILKPEICSVASTMGILFSTVGIFLLSLLTTELLLRLPLTKHLVS